ncbi:serine/threonine-protein kinase [Streptomyces sp. NPDC001480]|uniref:serine/threonine-protein kinase n=1 Tax=Streptomyces sp. NPDC001480 TaxID=3364577 RepID=UPI0036AE60D5
MPVRPWSAGPETTLRGTVLAGRYHLGALLGRGGAADVHEALDLQLRRPVAVKVFRAGTGAQTEERFAAEALLLARLEHPGLVTVHDYGRDEGRPFLVMQLFKGSTLRTRIAAGMLPRGHVCALGAALAEALAHVHAAGVVHRDVKPSNILLDETGAPHLTDFGISRLIDATSHTADGALVGTAAYLAPEQVTGREVGPAADVYALGLTLLECLKGRLEYDGAPLEAAIARLHRAPVIPAFLDGELSRLLRAMTAQEACDRPDAAGCAEALTALSGARPVLPAGAYGTGGADAPEYSADPEPLRTVAAPRRVPAVRRHGRRNLATAGAALTTLLGVTLTGSIVGLNGSGGSTASGADRHGPTARATEPSGTPSAPAHGTAHTAPRTPAVRSAQDPGTASGPSSARQGSDEAYGGGTATAAGPQSPSRKYKALSDPKKPKPPGQPKPPKQPAAPKHGKKH